MMFTLYSKKERAAFEDLSGVGWYHHQNGGLGAVIVQRETVVKALCHMRDGA